MLYSVYQHRSAKLGDNAMYIWITISIIIVFGTFICLRIAKIAGEADKFNMKLLLDQSIEEGKIILSECEYAYDCYLYKLVSYGTLPDCSKCRKYK